MTWPPTCSQDVREERELAREEERRTRVEAALHSEFCQDGWLGENALDQAIACPVCHPGLQARLNRSRWSA